ncbi:MAG: ribonucleotide-diphosphate reductase subunit beta [SAR116 cluster bacterium]|jgi:ribonucleoside-diphosphate reductase beta chain|nr:ribonucleotide-diphosphate reductase subunit beta [SAR116 cluster bacterium]RPG90051.1 MAG: ribonucleotide-diphosphate reductase subunit beta [Candidatus Puniceispirillum sp. TMED213]|tara:strand:+ start:6445 stop:7548 length:1104 start_codon:yes stop_codon:yes gene_type:complete
MAKTVFNREKIDFTKQNMFFGADQNTQRYDVFKFPVFDKLNQTMLGYFWRPEEVSLQKDRADFVNFRSEQKHIFTSNLKYQTLLDSVQGRGPCLAFLPYVSLPELEGCIVTWDFFETIHSRSYTHIMKNVYADPSEVFDTILDDDKIIERAVSVTKNYDAFTEAADLYFHQGKGSLRDVKKKMFLAMMNVNILEGLRFYVSFACTFAFGELKLMEGSAKIISLIARDESQHLALSTHVLKHWLQGKDDPEMATIAKECEEEVYEMWRTCVNEEKAWANYLFKDGSIIGLNETLLHQYVEYIANRRLKALGYKTIFDAPVNTNPLPWTQHWLSSSGLQVAPQETEVESYIIGGIKQDVSSDSLKDFKL